jgi:multidrug efflux pump subunit AcrB
MALGRAIVDGTCSRFRAVLLTSGTTIGGLTPLLFETSLQAQFMIPMAITIVFGLMVTTFLVLLLVPAMLGIQADLGVLARRFGERRAASA